ncbi:MAG: diguanylate cyclase, partial [Ruminococcaceae bacterium]|nr:diguanylate cyclase [Oscillospiraceae bacterium]
TKVELETFIANLPGGAFRYNDSENMEFQFVSDGLLKMFGYSREKFLEKYNNSFCDMIYEEDRIHTLSSIQQQFTQGKFAEVKYRVITAKGKIRWLLNRVQIVTNEDGQRQFYSVVVDITESKQAHKKANDAMMQLLTLANSIPGGVAQYKYEDGKLKLVYASEGFYRLCGYTEEEYKSQEHEGIENVHPDDCHFLDSMISRQIEEKRPIMAEFRMLQRDGKAIWVSLSGTRTVNQNQQVIYQCVFSDITTLKMAQEELEVEQERYQIAENLSDDIMFEYDIPADCMEFSPLFTALTGRYPNISGFLKDILHNESICGKDLPGFKAYLNELRMGNANSETEVRFITKSNESVWHRIKAKIIYDSYGKPNKAIGKAYNIDKQKKELQRLLDKSQRDPLTNLFNKTATQSQIEDHLADSASVEKHALLMIDIDNFKAINDQFGHMTGDEVIMEISHRIQKLFRTSDVVGRIGGDEFVVFLRDISTDDLIEEKAKAMCGIFRSTRASKDLSYQISGSIGIAMFPKDGKTYQELYPKADTALYKAKRRGKDCYEFYSEEDES